MDSRGAQGADRGGVREGLPASPPGKASWGRGLHPSQYFLFDLKMEQSIAQDRESSPARTGGLTTMLRHQLRVSAGWHFHYVYHMINLSHCNFVLQVRWQTVLWGFGLQLIIALTVLRSWPGRVAFKWLGDRATEFFAYTYAGCEYVFGPSYADHRFAFQVIRLCIICIYQITSISLFTRPDATMSDARGGQAGLKVYKTYLSPQFSRKWRSSLFLNIFSDVEVTIRSGKQFQLSLTLLEKANCPISKLNLL